MTGEHKLRPSSGGRLRLEEMDGWHCCPGGRGHHAGCYQPCYTLCVESQSDREAVEAVRYWWRRFRSLRFWQVRQRREALRHVRAARERAYASPRLPLGPRPSGLTPLNTRSEMS